MAKKSTRYHRKDGNWEDTSGFETDSIKEGNPRFLMLVELSDVTHVAVNSGEWNDSKTWQNGRIPGDGARVRIRPDVTVTLDHQDEKRIKTLRVDGELRVDPATDTRLRVETIVTTSGSRFEIGSGNKPVQSDVKAEIEFIDTGDIKISEDPFQVSRGLIALGDVEVVGAKKSSWHKLSRNPQKGDTSFELASTPTNWQPGDTVITPDVEPYTSSDLVTDSDGNVTDIKNKDEERKIDSISSETVKFTESLDYDHIPPESDLDTYVLNLTRNVKFYSENTTDSDRYGHIMLMKPGTTWKYVQLDNLGRTDKKEPVSNPLWYRGESDTSQLQNPRARYAWHTHRTGAGNSKHVVDGCTARDGPGWGFINHGSNVDFLNSVAYNFDGACFVTESGSEKGRMVGNFALRSYGSGEEGDSRKGWSNSSGTKMEDPPNNIDDWGHHGVGFWVHSPLFEIEDNVAAGCRAHGFVFWWRALYQTILGDNEELDGKLSANPMTPEKALDAYNDDYPAYAKVYGLRGDKDRERTTPVVAPDSNKFFNDTLPLRSFSNCEAFGCGAGTTYRSASFRNPGRHERGAIGTHGEYGSGGDSSREWSSLWYEPESFTAWNIGHHFLQDGTVQETFQNNFATKGSLGVDHRYVHGLRSKGFYLRGPGGTSGTRKETVGVYNNRSYTDDFDFTKSSSRRAKVKHWDIGFIPTREKSSVSHIVDGVDFSNNRVDVVLPEVVENTFLLLRNCTYTSNPARAWIEWEETGYGRATATKGTNINPRRLGMYHPHTHCMIEDSNGKIRTLYHGWSHTDFVMIESGDTERENSVIGGSEKEWEKLLNGDDPYDVLPGATSRQLYEDGSLGPNAPYRLTWFGGLKDKASGETRSDLLGSTPEGDSTYMKDPFLGEKDKSQPTDEIWIDPTHQDVTLENDASVVTESDYPNLVYAFQMANNDNLVKCSTSTTDGNAPDGSDDFIKYTFDVSTPFSEKYYQIFLRCHFPRYDGTNDGYRKPAYQIDGGTWKFAPHGMGGDTAVGWGRVTSNPVQLADGTHTLRLTADDKRIDMFADWILLKHETVGAAPIGKGKPHTT